MMVKTQLHVRIFPLNALPGRATAIPTRDILLPVDPESTFTDVWALAEKRFRANYAEAAKE